MEYRWDAEYWCDNAEKFVNSCYSIVSEADGEAERHLRDLGAGELSKLSNLLGDGMVLFDRAAERYTGDIWAHEDVQRRMARTSEELRLIANGVRNDHRHSKYWMAFGVMLEELERSESAYESAIADYRKGCERPLQFTTWETIPSNSMKRMAAMLKEVINGNFDNYQELRAWMAEWHSGDEWKELLEKYRDEGLRKIQSKKRV